MNQKNVDQLDQKPDVSKTVVLIGTMREDVSSMKRVPLEGERKMKEWPKWNSEPYESYHKKNTETYSLSREQIYNIKDVLTEWMAVIESFIEQFDMMLDIMSSTGRRRDNLE